MFWAQLFCVILLQSFFVQVTFMSFLISSVVVECTILIRSEKYEDRPLAFSTWALIAHSSWTVCESASHPLLWNLRLPLSWIQPAWKGLGERSPFSPTQKYKLYNAPHLTFLELTSLAAALKHCSRHEWEAGTHLLLSRYIISLP